MVRQGNHCHAHETATPGPGARIAAATSRGSKTKKRAAGAPRPRPAGSRTSPRKKRIHDPESKLKIFQAYLEWVEKGKPITESPIAQLMLKYGCAKNYPHRLYDLVKQRGSTGNQWVANPKEIPEEIWVAMVDLIREKRSEKKIASNRYLSRKLTSLFGEAIGKNAVSNAKRRMGFKTVKICIKPLLNATLMAERYAFAGKMKGKKFTHVLHADEKWFTEEKAEQMAVTARPSSPVARFRGKQAETRTQLDKLMFLTVVCEKKKIGQYELNFKEWNAVHVNSRTGKAAKGVTADMLAPVLRKIKRDARRELGARARLAIWFDKAGCHNCKATLALCNELFDEVILQPGKSPDMSMLDAGVFPWMEREVESRGATTKAEIRAAANAVFAALTPTMLGRVADRVRRNIDNVIKMKGGNFYAEGALAS